MLRPATPLSILFFFAFCLLLLSTLSAPVIKSVPLAAYRDIHFGILGYCQDANCTALHVGYNTETLVNDVPNLQFWLPSASRHALSSILIVHPIAALMTLACFALAAIAHLHSPSHSPRYLLALLMFALSTLLVSLLAFLVDILLFVPHVSWGGWVALVATVIICAAIVILCAMRRTLVSRKAKRRKIAENDEMNGTAHYANRSDKAIVTVEYTKAESPPSTGSFVSGTRGVDNAYFAVQKSPADDTQPLNRRNPSLRTVSSVGDNKSDATSPPARSPSGRTQPVNQQSMPFPPLLHDPRALNNGPPRGLLGGEGRGGSFRGRGGYPLRGGPHRGGSYRGSRGRGIGARGGMRGRPPGWTGNGRGGRPPQGVPMGHGAFPPRYKTNQMPYGPLPPREPSPYRNRGALAPAHAPIGQAIEMDNRAGIASKNHQPGENEGDVARPVVQQSSSPADASQRRPGQSLGNPTPYYSSDSVPPPQAQSRQLSYVPARAGWTSQKNASDQVLTTPSNNSTGRGLSPIMDSPIEAPAALTLPTTTVSANVETASEYYEDVEPRFARIEPLPSAPPPFVAGGQVSSSSQFLTVPAPTDRIVSRKTSFEDLPDGSRSPAASEASHFTSVSQRPVNPQWQSELGSAAGQYGPRSDWSVTRPEDRILAANAANPDFAIPVATSGRGRGRGRGDRGRARGPVPVNMMGPGLGLGNESRYPRGNAI